MMDRETLVYVDLDGAPHLMGRLWARVRKNKESATFEYDAAWLENIGPAQFVPDQTEKAAAAPAGNRRQLRMTGRTVFRGTRPISPSL
jgi:hypothetical protein